jgi:hypothetical protein
LGLFVGSIATRLLPQDVSETGGLSVRTSETLVSAVRGLARLQTVEMRLEKVVDLKDRQSRFWGMIETEDALLLIASAKVTAGIDLSLVDPGDVEVYPEEKRVRLVLPSASVFSVSLDNESTYVYSRSTELLARRNDQLETKARTLAEEMLKQSAEDSDVLELASGNAARVLTSFLSSLGYEHVELVFDGPTRE